LSEHTLGRRLRRWLRPPRQLRPTRAGWLFFALTLGVGFAALNTGNNLLYLVFCFLLGFLVLSGLLSEACLRRISVGRRLPRELFAESPTHVVIEVENAQRRISSFAIVVEDLVGPDIDETQGAGRAFFLRVGPGESRSRPHRFVAERRGPLAFAGFRVSTRFPFGLFSKSMVVPASEETLVYPALEPVDEISLGGARAGGDAPRSSGSGPGSASASLRDFARGDSPRSVHWRTSLKRDRLQVREREAEERPEYVVVLRTAARSDGDAFERDVSRAASEVLFHLDAGERVGLRTDAAHYEADAGPQHRSALLSFLARVCPEPSPAGALDDAA